MRHLSISRAWDESKAILVRDGRLFVSVALALVAFPTLIAGIINPKGMGTSVPLWVSTVSLILSLITLAGQLALIRLALGPSITVGAAIQHGMRRMPIYLVSVIIMVALLFLAAIPFAAALAAMGVPIRAKMTPSPSVGVAVLLYLVLFVFVGVRMSMSAPAASAEPIGPIAVLKRSWQLTAGNFWRLLAFLIMYLIAAVVVLVGIPTAVGSVLAVLTGPIERMSVTALLIGLVEALLTAALTAVFAVMVARIYAQLAGRGEAESGVPITGI